MRFLVRRLKSWEDRMNIGNIFYVLLYKLLRFISEDLCRTRTLHLSSANMRIWEYGTRSRRFADFQFHRLLGLSVDWCGNWDCRNPHFRFASSMGLKMVKLMIGLGWSGFEFRTPNLVWFTIHSIDITHACGPSVARKWLPGMPTRLSCMTRLVVGWCCQTYLDVRLTTNWVYFPRFVETSKQMMSPCSSFWRKQQKLWFCVAGVFFPPEP